MSEAEIEIKQSRKPAGKKISRSIDLKANFFDEQMVLFASKSWLPGNQCLHLVQSFQRSLLSGYCSFLLVVCFIGAMER